MLAFLYMEAYKRTMIFDALVTKWRYNIPIQSDNFEFERKVLHEEKRFTIANTCSCNSRIFRECLDYGSDNRYGRILPTSSVHNGFLDLFGQTVCTQMENTSRRIDCSYSGVLLITGLSLAVSAGNS